MMTRTLAVLSVAAAAVLLCSRPAAAGLKGCNLPGPGVGCDPIVNGFDGTQFTFAGFNNTPYSLLSSAHHQVNALFLDESNPKHRALLNGGGGTWINELAIHFGGRWLSVRALDLEQNLEIMVDDVPIFTSAEDASTVELTSWTSVSITSDPLYTREDSKVVSFSSPALHLEVWAHAPVKFSDASLDQGTPALGFTVQIKREPTCNMRGLLGMTYAWMRNPTLAPTNILAFEDDLIARHADFQTSNLLAKDAKDSDTASCLQLN